MRRRRPTPPELGREVKMTFQAEDAEVAAILLHAQTGIQTCVVDVRKGLIAVVVPPNLRGRMHSVASGIGATPVPEKMGNAFSIQKALLL